MVANEPITPAQLKQLHVLLGQTGFTPYKQDLMDTYCIDNRFPASSKTLYKVEAANIISHLKDKYNEQQKQSDTMRKKVISCLRECHFNKSGRADMPRIYSWVEKYSPFKKGLNKHNYNELVQLVTQAEIMKSKHLKGLANG